MNDEIIRRLERLERQNRLLKLGGVLALIGATLLAAGGAKRANVLEAERFVLRDSLGTVRASLNLLDNGTSVLTMMDGLGRPRTNLSVSKDGSGMISFHDDAKRTSGYLSVANGESSLVFFDRNHRKNIYIENRTITLFDSANKRRASLSLLDDGRPLLVFDDEAGKDRASLALHDKGAPALVLADEVGKTRARLWEHQGYPLFLLDGGEDESTIKLDVQAKSSFLSVGGKKGFNTGTTTDVSGMTLNGSDGKPRMAIAVKPDGTAGLKLLDKAGKVLFEAPTAPK